MNIDLSAQTQFNDAMGLKSFFLVHQFVHDQEAGALTAKYQIPISTFGISSQAAEEAWGEIMRQGAAGEKVGKVPQALRDWLKYHADMHTQAYTLLGSSPTVAPDLSVADFSMQQSFDDWMFVHQAMHDFEYQQLGLT
jgi:hypothetical protein